MVLLLQHTSDISDYYNLKQKERQQCTNQEIKTMEKSNEYNANCECW